MRLQTARVLLGSRQRDADRAAGNVVPHHLVQRAIALALVAKAHEAVALAAPGDRVGDDLWRAGAARQRPSNSASAVATRMLCTQQHSCNPCRQAGSRLIGAAAAAHNVRRINPTAPLTLPYNARLLPRQQQPGLLALSAHAQGANLCTAHGREVLAKVLLQRVVVHLGRQVAHKHAVVSCTRGTAGRVSWALRHLACRGQQALCNLYCLVAIPPKAWGCMRGSGSQKASKPKQQRLRALLQRQQGCRNGDGATQVSALTNAQHTRKNLGPARQAAGKDRQLRGKVQRSGKK